MTYRLGVDVGGTFTDLLQLAREVRGADVLEDDFSIVRMSV